MIAIDPYIIAGLSWFFVLAGSFFYVTGAFGLVRMPDMFTRMHAASVTDTLGAGMLIVAMMLQSGFNLNTGRLAIILLILFFASPITTHALARAAQFAGLKPELVEDRTRRATARADSAKGKAAPRARGRRSASKGGQPSKR